MSHPYVAIVPSLPVCVRAILVGRGEVAILSLAPIERLGKSRELTGVLLGLAGPYLVFRGVREDDSCCLTILSTSPQVL